MRADDSKVSTMKKTAKTAAFAPCRNESESAEPGQFGGEEFFRQVLESSSDCIKVLNLDAQLVFMSAGGMRVMEIDDFAPFVGCPWFEFWTGDLAVEAHAAVALAKAGGLGRFQGPCRTAKGTPRWWDVQVTPINGPDGRPAHLLAISRDITQLKRAEERQHLLAQEMHHRVKNMLAIVQAIAGQTLRDAVPMRDARESFLARLRTLDAAQDMLIREISEGASIGNVVAAAMEPHTGSSERLRVDGPAVMLGARQALALAMALHELATNAAKYGALSGDAGNIEIAWNIDEPASEGPRLHLRWTERGGPPVTPPAVAGFGSRLIERSLAAEFGGEVSLAYEPNGVVCTIDAPLPALKTA